MPLQYLFYVSYGAWVNIDDFEKIVKTYDTNRELKTDYAGDYFSSMLEDFNLFDEQLFQEDTCPQISRVSRCMSRKDAIAFRLFQCACRYGAIPLRGADILENIVSYLLHTPQSVLREDAQRPERLKHFGITHHDGGDDYFLIGARLRIAVEMIAEFNYPCDIIFPNLMKEVGSRKNRLSKIERDITNCVLEKICSDTGLCLSAEEGAFMKENGCS